MSIPALCPHCQGLIVPSAAPHHATDPLCRCGWTQVFPVPLSQLALFPEALDEA
jgi:hypothetical protein